MIPRLANLLLSNSFFLFGARGTGKTTLLKDTFKDIPHTRIDLLNQDTFAKLLAYPQEIERMIGPEISRKGWVIIDEIQKVPALLDLVHKNIEEHELLFAMSGSSARKLKRGSANMLAGRAFTYHLLPFLQLELADRFDLEFSLRWGMLPKIWELSSDLERSLFLQAYTETYLQEEIVAEQIVRKLAPFRRFLQVAAQSNAQVVNFAKIAADANTDPSNVRNYYQVLEDTLLGFFLEPFHLSVRKRQRQSPKFYFFDLGVVRALQQSLDVAPRSATYEYGRLFESFVILQIYGLLKYSKKQFALSYLLTKDNAEVDLIIERAGQPTYFIEIKSSTDVRDQELNSLRKLAQDVRGAKPICLYRGSQKLLSNGVEILPWREGLTRIIHQPSAARG